MKDQGNCLVCWQQRFKFQIVQIHLHGLVRFDEEFDSDRRAVHQATAMRCLVFRGRGLVRCAQYQRGG